MSTWEAGGAKGHLRSWHSYTLHIPVLTVNPDAKMQDGSRSSLTYPDAGKWPRELAQQAAPYRAPQGVRSWHRPFQTLLSRFTFLLPHPQVFFKLKTLFGLSLLLCMQTNTGLLHSLTTLFVLSHQFFLCSYPQSSNYLQIKC